MVKEKSKVQLTKKGGGSTGSSGGGPSYSI